MRITIVYRYFWPDTPPYASMLKDLSAWLVEAGHEVSVITAQPAYKPEVGIPRQPSSELFDGAKVIRLPLLPEKGHTIVKAINSLLFIAMSVAIVVFGKRADLVWTATIPPVVQAFFIRLAARIRGSKFLYHMQDIHPEISGENGYFGQRWLIGLLRTMDIHTLKKASRVVLLSQDMRETIIDRGVNQDKIRVVRNFSRNADSPHRAKPAGNREVVRFVFAGNIGRFQNLEKLVDAFSLLDGEGIELLLIGDGKVKKRLVDAVLKSGAKNVQFRAHMSEDEVYEHMTRHHVGVISLKPGLYHYAFPSKLLTYLAANLPILAMIESSSELAEIIRERNLGVSVDWGSDEEALEKAILSAAKLARLGTARSSKQLDLYHPDTAREQWTKLISEVEAQGAGS